MVSTNEKIKVLKSICDYYNFDLLLLDKIVIDGRKACGSNKHYYIYNNIDEALIEWEDLCIAASKNAQNGDFKYNLQVIEEIKKYSKKNDFSYLLKKSILEYISSIEDINNFDFKFRQTSIIVTYNSHYFLFNDIDDVLLEYHDLIKQYAPNKYDLVCNMIIDKSIAIIKQTINKHLYSKTTLYPFGIDLTFIIDKNLGLKKNILECCDIVTKILNKKILLNNSKSINYSNKLNKKYLSTCKEIVNQKNKIESIYEKVSSSNKDKINLANKMFEIIQNEFKFNILELETKFKLFNSIEDIDKYKILLANDLLSDKNKFNIFISYLIDENHNKIINSKHYLNDIYNYIDKFLKKYDIYIETNNILKVLRELEIPDDKIKVNFNEENNKQEIVLDINSEKIIIRENKIYYKDKEYLLKDIDVLKNFIKQNITKNNICLEEKENYSNNIEKSIEENKFNKAINIINIYNIEDVSINKNYYTFKLLCLVDDSNKLNVCDKLKKSKNEYAYKYNSYLNCSIYCMDKTFDFNNIDIKLICSNGKEYDYNFTTEEINIIKTNITNYIIENQLWDTNIDNKLNITNPSDNSLDNENKSEEYKFEIDEHTLYIYINNDKEKVKNISIPKEELIKVLIKQIDNTTLLKELENRLK